MADLLFCPFCRECFEGEQRCPDHELPLVPFEALPKARVEQPDDAPMSILDPSRGRAELAIAGVALLASFLAPIVEVTSDARSETFSALAAASQRAPNLWAIPIAGAILVSTVSRRRVPLRMRGARLALVFVSLVPLVSIGYSVRRIFEASSIAGMTSTMSFGPYVIGAAALLGVVGSLRFGGRAIERATPPSAPDSGVSR